MRAQQPLVRARVWSTPSRHRGCRYLCWHYAVTVGDVVVLYDNTADYQSILRSALIRVEAVRHMVIAGHQLKAYEGAIG